MDKARIVDVLTTPKTFTKLELIEHYTANIKRSSEMLQNALENDRVLIVGREAQNLAEATQMLLELLK